MKPHNYDIEDKALCVLDALMKAEESYKRVNKVICEELGSDFFTALPIENNAMVGIVDLLDYILGDNLASYMLYDRPRSGGKYTTAAGKEFPMNTMEDVMAWIREGAEA
jgi:hypothetical protein